MRNRYLLLLAAYAMVCVPASALADSGTFSFGVIAHGYMVSSDEAALRNTLIATDAENLAFVVANGIKSGTEPCTDQLYNGRKALLEESQHGLVLSLAASDWVDCRRADGRSAAIERLNRVRDLFFVGEFSIGRTKIPLVRQSLTPKFRNYGENAQWTMGGVKFATVNLPAKNNHFLSAAGRNSEFEDRQVANRTWLEQLFNVATRKNLKAIVIFCDGNPFAHPKTSSLFGLSTGRDGFSDIRRQITSKASKFRGKVLVVHGQPEPDSASGRNINWRGNLGILGVGSGWTKLIFDPSLPALFDVNDLSAPSRK